MPAGRRGGRWNSPGGHPTLYLNEDLATARAQIWRLLEGQPVEPEDLDPPWVLVRARLPARQVVADAVGDGGLAALGLPPTYPLGPEGEPVDAAACRPVGDALAGAGVRGVHCRSAATLDGSGRELAWFPARPTSRAHQIGRAVPFERWFWAAAGG